jgi:molybdopterin/thiamine biosynthesis adenylyltransferase
MNPEIQIDIGKELEKGSKKILDPAGREIRVMEEDQAEKTAAKYSKSIHNIYLEALKRGISPYRYIRNQNSISIDDQLKLAESCIAVLGAGGLGGHVITLLARIGIGHLIIVDHDVFDETNLNRQSLSNRNIIGKSKSEGARSVIASINPGVEVSAYETKINTLNVEELLTGSNVVVDALDNIHDRFILQDAAIKLGIPLVHGAVAGFEGQVATIFPDDPDLEKIYGRDRTDRPKKNNPESILGVPAFAPSVIASFQAMEAIKIILGKEPTFRNKLGYIDLEKGQINKFSFKK